MVIESWPVLTLGAAAGADAPSDASSAAADVACVMAASGTPDVGGADVPQEARMASERAIPTVASGLMCVIARSLSAEVIEFSAC